MKRLYAGAVLTGVALAIAGCHGDPNASLRNGPATLTVTPNQIFFDTGAAGGPVVVTARDAQLNPVPVLITGTSAAPTVATVVRDTSRPVVDSSSYPFLVTPGNLGQAKITFTGGGITDTAIVIVLPVEFKGAISDTLPVQGAPVVIHSTATLKFDPAKDTVTFGTGAPQVAVIAVNTPDSLVVLTPYASDPGPMTIAGIVAAPGLDITRPTQVHMHPTGDRWAGDTSWQTAPDITSILPAAAGQSTHLVSTTAAHNNKTVCPEFVGVPANQASSGPCMMFKFTVGGATSLSFTTDWDGTATNPDIDIYACSDSTLAGFGANCFEEGGHGATASKPQSTGPFVYPAGTHYFVIENFVGGPSKNLRTTITRQ